MAACRKDTPNALLDGSGNLVRKIRFTSDRKTLELILLGLSTTVECTNNIDSSTYLGVKIQGNDLVFTGPISGLTTNLSSPVGNNPLVSITKTGSVLNIIGIDDMEISFAVTQVNVRYDAATNSVLFQV